MCSHIERKNRDESEKNEEKGRDWASEKARVGARKEVGRRA